MSTQTPMAATAALAEAATAAVRAPSAHNTQPWRWRVGGDALDLYADRSRQLAVADPEGRMLTISCGTALHHARVALAAAGWAATVGRLPDPADPDHLARITVADRTDVTPAAMRLLQTVSVRHTDRRPVVETALPDGVFEQLRQAATAEHTGLHPLRPDDLAELAAASARANEIGITDPDQRAELAQWIGGERPDGTGIPDSALPARPPQSAVPASDWGHPGTLTVGPGHDLRATYAILFGRSDTTMDWLRAGEALSALWLTATERGVAVLPLSTVVEIVATRERVRRILSRLDYPYLVLRLGLAAPDKPAPARTPRLRAEQVIERTQ